jgi:hypothetical protein
MAEGYASGNINSVSVSRNNLGKTIDRNIADAYAKIVPLPMHSSLINQTSMTIDAKGAPTIATWWAPEAAKGNHTRQYMLIWKDGNVWRTSQISRRAPGEDRDVTSFAVRQMGRPLVLVDKNDRVIVVTRSADAGKPVEDASNRLRIYWSTDRLHSLSLELSTVNPGAREPSYDQAQWQSQNKLSLFFQSCGLGAQSARISVLTWDEPAFFADHAADTDITSGIPEPGSVH